jgi:hypothetical protein
LSGGLEAKNPHHLDAENSDLLTAGRTVATLTTSFADTGNHVRREEERGDMANDDLSTRAPESQDIADQIKELKALIGEQHRRIAELEANRTSKAIRTHDRTEQPSRRDLLRRAGQVGVATAGAVGGMALLSQGVAATQGSAVLAGVANTETGTTVMEGAGTTPVSPIFSVTSSGSTATFATALHAIAAFNTDTAFEANGDATAPSFSAQAIFAHTTDGIAVNATATNGFAMSGAASAAAGIGVVAWAGGRAPLSVTPAAAAGAPTANAHALGDVWTDNKGMLWICVTSGTPGVFAPLQTGGANISHFVKVSNTQFLLTNSDGATWRNIDGSGALKLVITPLFSAQAVISVSVDLWTASAGLNQDIGLYIEGGTYGAAGAGKIVAWKESGGFAGTYSPNAAFVETTQPMVAATAYTIIPRWKTNKPAGGGIIAAGAGPLPTGSAGGGVAGQISPTRLAVHLIPDVPNPSVLAGPVVPPRNDPNRVPAAAKPVRRA